MEVCGHQSGMSTFVQVSTQTDYTDIHPDHFHFYRRAMMEKEDEGAGEDDAEDEEVDAKGELGGPVDTVMAQAQGPVSQPTQQENEMQDVLMEDAGTLLDVTDPSSSPVLL
jgi:hypothetical protein